MFADRTEAGAELARALAHLKAEDAVVYGLPRGGVPVALEVARTLGKPLDLVMVRKIGAPGHAEFAIGAVVDGDTPVIVRRDDIIAQTGAGEDYMKAAVDAALAELRRRRAVYVKAHEARAIAGRTAILVDDGLATGATMECAVEAMRRAGAAHITVAAPVAPPETVRRLSALADEVICIATPEPFWAVGNHYRRFEQLNDADVVRLLETFRQGNTAA